MRRLNGSPPDSRGAVLARLLVLLAALLGARASAAGPEASVCALVDLGTLGGSSSAAVAVNSRGQVVGNSLTADGSTHAFLWTARDGMIDLGTLGGATNSFASAMNERGQVVGSSGAHAFSWTAQGGMIDIDTIGSGPTRADAVNDHGEVVGIRVEPSYGRARLFLWTARDGMVDVAGLGAAAGAAVNAFTNRGQAVGYFITSNAGGPMGFSWTARGGPVHLNLGGRLSDASDANERGQAVGYSDVILEGHAFVWSARDGMLDLGVGSARAVNEGGQVVGFSGESGHAFSWTEQHGMVDLGTLGGSSSGASAVNESGQVVGSSTTSDGSVHAFSWTARGGMIDLGTLGGGSSRAIAVNNRGQIVGNSLTADGSIHAFSWTCPSQ